MRWKVHFGVLAVVAGVLFFTHYAFLRLPYFWDEIGYFIPSALDLFREGRLVPVSTPPNAHPPLVMAYLAGAWKLAGFSILTTRLAMLLAAFLSLAAAYLLAVRLAGARRRAVLAAMLFLLLSPLLFMQAMLAQLDMPAMGLTALALWLFLDDRIGASVAACTALVLVKETGIAVPFVLGVWLARERRPDAAWFLLPAAALVAWLANVHRVTGHWLGSPEFAGYNLFYPLHPFRLSVALLRRFYALAIADFHWVGTLAIAASRRIFTGRAWTLVAAVAGTHVLEVSVLGGAQLERYLLPVLPIFYIAAAVALEAQPRPLLGCSLMAAGLLTGLFWNPPYPFPYENNLAMADTVRLQQAAAGYLERNYPGAPVTTAWPMSEALRSADFGYVSRGRPVHDLKDFRAAQIAGAAPMDILLLYSRDWRPLPALESWWRRYFDYDTPMTPQECERAFGLVPVARWEAGGQWMQLLAKPRLLPAGYNGHGQ